jgi:hypothetical protein
MTVAKSKACLIPCDASRVKLVGIPFILLKVGTMINKISKMLEKNAIHV